MSRDYPANVSRHTVIRRIGRSLDLIGRLLQSSPSPANFQSRLFTPIADLVSKVQARPDVHDKLSAEVSSPPVQARLSLLVFDRDVIAESTRLARADVALALSSLIAKTNRVGGSTLQRLLDTATQGERSSAVNERLATALRQLA